MADLDLTGYLELYLLEDVDAQELVERALELAATRLPGWEPREGNTEVVAIEALALEADELVFRINRLPGAIVEALLRLYGLERDQGTPPTADVLFVVSDADGHTVPAGTSVLVELSTAEDALELTTDRDLVVPAGSSSAVVEVTGTEPTDRGNGVDAGTVLEVLDAVPFVERAELATDLGGGAPLEDGPTFLDRGSRRLQRLVTTLVLPEHFVAAVLEDPRVGRATAVDLYDPGQAGQPGDHAGHVTVAVADTAGTALTVTVRDELDATLEEQAQANLAVHVVDPDLTTIDVEVTVTRRRGYDPAAVEGRIGDATLAYLDPSAWPWDDVVRRFELVALVDGVEGVSHVDEVRLATSGGALATDDVALPGIAPLAQLGVLTVTVAAP